MSTNYYLRHKPSFTQINELTDLIRSTKNGEHFSEVIDMVHKIYGEPDVYDETNEWGKLHIGKRSCGWKFQWCPNIIRKNVSFMEYGEYIKIIIITLVGIALVYFIAKYYFDKRKKTE